MSGKALVVDDSTSARAVLAQQLRDQQIEVDAVDSGEAALRYLEEQHPDVIFMDHLLPGMDGFEALRAIKENPETCNIPVLMYTSKRGEVYLNQVRELGAAGVLPKGNKPIQVSKVLRSLRLASPHGTAGNPDNGNV
ncbi:MAG: response regulator, partial [Gammaproteobacteria bacterium]|nr:response regulator [Gammaproteobacteria bacterium]